jgi:hypothetical protein
VPTRNVAPEATLKLGKETTELSKGQFCVSLDGSASHDKASVDDTTGALSAFVWDFGDGSPVATLSAPQPDTSAASSTLSQRCFESIECTGSCPEAPQHIYSMPVGSVVLARLQVRDNDGTLSEPSVLRVSLRTNRPPVARYVAAAGPASLTVSFDGSTSSDPDPDDSERLHFFWDFDDGSCDPPGIRCPPQPDEKVCKTTNDDDRHKMLEHRYAAPGVYRPMLYVSDGELCSGPAYQDVTVVGQ